MLVNLVTTLGYACIPLVLLWGLSVRLRDVSIVDIYWGLGFIWMAALSASRSSVDSVLSEIGMQQVLILIAVSLWGTRLSLYLLWRNWGAGEDKRYQEMRSKFPKFWLSSLPIVFLLQGFLSWVVSLPLQVCLLSGSHGLGLINYIGLAVWAVGLFFEAVGDFQLARFKDKAQSGDVLRTGLWRYTRHPNYFGDFLVWWGLFLLSFTNWGNAWTVIGPIVMTVLLLKVSGVALLERDLSKRKPDYQKYVKNTPAFFPWFPKTSA